MIDMQVFCGLRLSAKINVNTFMFEIEKKVLCEQLERILQMVNRLLNIHVVKNQMDQFNH